ncbi:MAG: hypothetical protein ACTHMV_19480 [Chitinophagaceae bacterium]
MQKLLFSLTLLAAIIMAIFPACKKEDNFTSPETRTELLVKTSWKFEKAEASPIGDISSQLEACQTDNLLIFSAASASSTSGTGTLDEGPTKCDPSGPQSGSFNWELINDGTVLRSSVPLFSGGSTDFTIVSLTSTNLVLSQQMQIDPYPATTVTITLKH